MKVSVPGKTFLLGEYLALSGGPSLIACTAPRFTLETLGGAKPPFHPQSPAGRLVSDVETTAWSFHDPHSGQGGLGASSAQYLAAWVAIRGMPSDWSEFLDEYRSFAWNGEGQAPSGADLVAQACGGITYYDGVQAKALVLEWKFEDLGFTLVRTGHKLATHEHLQAQTNDRAGSGREAELATLRPLVEHATRALRERDGDLFASSVLEYGARLGQAGWLTPTTAELLAEIRGAARKYGFDLRASKGCGAMGADVMLLVHGKGTADQLSAWCAERRLIVCGRDSELSPGVEVEL